MNVSYSFYAKKYNVNKNTFLKYCKRLNISLEDVHDKINDILQEINLPRREKLFKNRDKNRISKRNYSKEWNVPYTLLCNCCYKFNIKLRDIEKNKSFILDWINKSPLEKHDFSVKEKNIISFKFYADKLGIKDFIFRDYCHRYKISLDDIPIKWEEICAYWSMDYSKRVLFSKRKDVSKFCEDNNYTTIVELMDVVNYSQSYLSKIISTLELKTVYYKTWTLISKDDVPKIEKYAKEHEYSHFSGEEYSVKEFLTSLNVDFVENSRDIIPPKELDIYIPSKNIAIEYNGVAWHSTYRNVDKNYHLNKTVACEQKGINLIHIFSDEWLYKKEIIKSIIKAKLGIYEKKIFARKCEIRQIEKEAARSFLENNHIQGFANGLHYGLFYKDELVQLISLGKNRFKKGEIELYRMCTKLNTQVVGGFSKLLKHQPYDELYFYVDRRLFDGKGYFNINWRFVQYSKPSYYYTNCKKRFNRVLFQKHKLSKKLESFNPSLTEEENMKNNGYYRIYDCGTIKFCWNKN